MIVEHISAGTLHILLHNFLEWSLYSSRSVPALWGDILYHQAAKNKIDKKIHKQADHHVHTDAYTNVVGKKKNGETKILWHHISPTFIVYFITIFCIYNLQVYMINLKKIHTVNVYISLISDDVNMDRLAGWFLYTPYNLACRGVW